MEGERLELRSLIGRDFPPGPAIKLSRERVKEFCEATGPIPEETVAPFLLLSLLPRLAPLSALTDAPLTSINYGLDRTEVKRLLSPGESVRARQVVVAVDDLPGGTQIKRRVTVEDEQGSEVMVVETLTRLLLRG